MTRQTHYILGTLIFFFLLIPTFTHAEVIDRVIAVVNNEIITQSEIDQKVDDYWALIQQSIPAEQKAEAKMAVKQKLLQNLIDKKLIDQLAQRRNITVSSEEIDEVYIAQIEKTGLSETDFLAQLEAAGASKKMQREQIRTQLLQRKLVQIFISSKLVVTEDMIMNYYKSEYAKEASGGFHLLQIGCTWDSSLTGEELDTARKEAYQCASGLREQTLKGKNFRKLAKSESQLSSAEQGGDIGIFKEDEMSQLMKEAVVGLAPGNISQLVETSDSYQFFKRAETQITAKNIPLPSEQRKKEIHDELMDKLFKDEYASWFAQIKDLAYIKVL